MEIREYVRKPFVVEAIRVTSENIDEVAKWCGGGVYRDATFAYIKVNVRNPATPRQGRAFVGDWILSSQRGFKVYNNAAFEKTFDERKRKAYDPLERVEEAIKVFNDGGVSQVHIVDNVMQNPFFDPIYHEDDAVSLNIPKDGPATLAEGHVLYRIGALRFVIVKDDKTISNFTYSHPEKLAHLITVGTPPTEHEWTPRKDDFIRVSGRV